MKERSCSALNVRQVQRKKSVIGAAITGNLSEKGPDSQKERQIHLAQIPQIACELTRERALRALSDEDEVVAELGLDRAVDDTLLVILAEDDVVELSHHLARTERAAGHHSKSLREAPSSADVSCVEITSNPSNETYIYSTGEGGLRQCSYRSPPRLPDGQVECSLAMSSNEAPPVICSWTALRASSSFIRMWDAEALAAAGAGVLATGPR